MPFSGSEDLSLYSRGNFVSLTGNGGVSLLAIGPNRTIAFCQRVLMNYFNTGSQQASGLAVVAAYLA